MAQAFDTLAAARQLTEAGLQREHAEAVASIARDAANADRADRDELATRADLARLTAAAEADLKVALAKLEAGLTWRMVVLGGAVVAAMKLIP